MFTRLCCLTLVTSLLTCGSAVAQPGNSQSLRPYAKNLFYWEYQGEPVLLVGGSKDDNLFQLPDLEEHLDEIQAVGGNYIRNTMSDRPDKGHEVYAYARLENGKFDLDAWNDVYWERFDKLLKLTHERQIFVQIEVWDRFDYSRENWLVHPYNPVNNVNYTQQQSGLEPRYPEHPGTNRQPFFFTTPGQRNNERLLGYQQRYVDKLLSYSLRYDHVLYCIDNETSGQEAWATYWRDWIVQRAKEAEVAVQVTEMWDDWNLQGRQHRLTLDHPERFSFVDVSQNNHQKGETHWENFQWVRQYLATKPRPINTVKTYGADGNKFGHTDQDGKERFFRHLIGGAAAARFHRPDSGLGLNDAAKQAIRAVRQLETRIKLWDVEPCMELLGERKANEAYACGSPAVGYLVYFPLGGRVTLDLPAGNWSLEWLDLTAAAWQPKARLNRDAGTRILTPSDTGWIAVLQPID